MSDIEGYNREQFKLQSNRVSLGENRIELKLKQISLTIKKDTIILCPLKFENS